jgi:polyisoprenoid-binding protein YceI
MPKQTLKVSLILSVLLLFAVGCSSGSAQIPSTGASPAPSAVIMQASPTASLSSTTPAAATNGPSAPTAQSTTGAVSGETQYVIVADKSEARYRVRERLASLDAPSDAIGKTQQISGSIFVKPDGSIDSANSKFTVDLSTLQSDRSQRDNFLRRAVLQTDQFKDAVFVPTQVTGLPSPLPQSGPVSFKVAGNLTVRDVTKPVTWDVTGTMQNGVASGTATTSFTFEDFNLTQPKFAFILSIVDHIALEVDLTVQPK